MAEARLLDAAQTVTEPGAAVRWLNEAASRCPDREALALWLREISATLGVHGEAFLALTGQGLGRMPFYPRDMAQPLGPGAHLGAATRLLVEQSEAVQRWYGEYLPHHTPVRQTLPAYLTLRLAEDADVPRLRWLINAAYAELGDMGLFFLGVTQDEALTRERMAGKDIWVLEDTADGALAATMALSVEDSSDGKDADALYLGQFGVRPDLKGGGLGAFLIHHAFAEARARGLRAVMLDTAVPAHHLVWLYRRFGFEVIEVVKWRKVNYPSYIMRAGVGGPTLSF